MSAILPRDTRSLYVAWEPSCFRATQTAYVLGCELVFVRPFDGVGPLRTLWRYLVSTPMTIGLLAKRRPRRLAILNQPTPLAVIAGLYARLTGAPLILDCHSKVFDEATWWIETAPYPWLSRLARLSINHNPVDGRKVRAWGGRSVVIEALQLTLPVKPTEPTPQPPFVLFVCSFAQDEPIATMLDAARALPDVRIRMTGDPRKRGLTTADVPPNVELTGYLPAADYYGAYKAAAAVLSLSDRGYIMQMACGESILMGTPLVVNRSPTIEGVMGDAAIYVDLTAEDIARGLREALARPEVLRERLASVRRQTEADALAKLEGAWGA